MENAESEDDYIVDCEYHKLNYDTDEYQKIIVSIFNAILIEMILINI